MNSKTMKGLSAALVLTLFFVVLPLESQARKEKHSLFASKIIDAAVYDQNQQEIGEVDDLIIRRSGTVKKLTVEFGGFLDVGDKLVSLFFKKFHMENGKAMLEVKKQELQKRPAVNYYEMGLRPGYYYSIAGPQGYYGYGYGYPPAAPYRYGHRMQRKTMELFEWAYSPPRFLATVIMYRRLVNEEGKDIGRVKDLVIDRDKKEVEKIIISSEDILGADVYAGLPYKPLGFTAYGLVYEIQAKELKDFIYPYQK